MLSNSPTISFPLQFLDEISKADSLQLVLEAVAAWLPSIIEADRCSIALPVDERHLRLFAIHTNTAVEMNELLNIDDTLAGKVYRSQELHVINNLANRSQVDCQRLHSAGFNSAMIAPLNSGDKCYGLINILYKKPYFYSEQDALELVGVADWVASNIRIHRQIDKERKLASTDSLTGLLNRRAFIQENQNALANFQKFNRSFVFAILDIDHFKHVNDTYGHQAGDAALVAFSKKLKSMVRSDDYVARLGGEEFGITLNHMQEEHAMAWANRFRKAASKIKINHEGKSFTFTVSIGISLPSDDDDKFDDIINRADKALYEAKNAGRNLVKLAS